MIISHINDYFEKNKSPILSKIKTSKVEEDQSDTVSKIKESTGLQK